MKNDVSRRTFFGRLGAGGIGIGVATILPQQAIAQSDLKSLGWFNIKDFGAANSPADSTTAIQAAITAAVNNNGGYVYFPAGEYKTTATLKVPDVKNGMALCGDGNQTRIQASGDYDIIAVGTGPSVNGLLIRDLFFHGPGPSASVGSAISLNGVSDFRIVNVSSFETGIGFNFLGTAFGRSISIENCFVDAAKYGLQTQSGISVFASSFAGKQVGAVLDSIGGACRFFGVCLYGPLSLTTRNSLNASNPAGLWCYDVECNWEPGTNPPEGPGGMNLDSFGGEIHLDHCWAPENGITLGGNIFPRYVQISGGSYSGGAKQLPHAIHIKSGSNIIITGAHIRGGGIVIENQARKFQITGCAFDGSQHYCIDSAATQGPNTIVGNIFEGWHSDSGPIRYPKGSESAYALSGNCY